VAAVSAKIVGKGHTPPLQNPPSDFALVSQSQTRSAIARNR